MKMNGQTRVIVATAAMLALVDIGVRVATVRAPGASMSNGVVTAREFRLVDQDGNARATISLDRTGEPGLRMYDRNGDLRLQLDSWQNNPSLIFLDNNGHRRTFFGTDIMSGQGVFTEYNDQGIPTSSMSLDGSGINGTVSTRSNVQSTSTYFEASSDDVPVISIR